MTEKEIQLYDKQNMRKLILDFPTHIDLAIEIANKVTFPKFKKIISNIVITGLGGSAIGGDLVRSYLSDEVKIPIFINRNYILPNFVNENSLVIISSYSGNTEETISTHIDATKRKANIICISSNGKIFDLAKKYQQTFVELPKGFPPRTALAFSFFTILQILSRLEIVKSQTGKILETKNFLLQKSFSYSSLNEKKNLSLQIAKKIFKKIPIIYSATDKFDVVNLRWRGQICENSKQLAFGNLVPEMNHNELVGWNLLKDKTKNFVVIYLKDKYDNPRVKLRMEVMEKIIQKHSNIIQIQSEGISDLTRIFSLIYLGDWISFYLAILNKTNPTPVEVIDYLKSEIAKIN